MAQTPRRRQAKHPLKIEIDRDARGAPRRALPKGDPLDALIVEVPVKTDPVVKYVDERRESLADVYRTLRIVRSDLSGFLATIDEPLPPSITGRLVNADGSPGRFLSVTVPEPDYSDRDDTPPWPTPRASSDENGLVTIKLPDAPLPADGLKLVVSGRAQSITIPVRRVDVASGKLGVVVLPVTLAPTAEARDVLERIRDALPDIDEADENPEEFSDPPPVITLGEDDCRTSFQSNTGVVDRYRYSLLVRLVEPLIGAERLSLVITLENGNKVTLPNPLDKRLAGGAFQPGELIDFFSGRGEFELIDRVALDEPVDVPGFHDDVEESPREVPKAGTLGLGYVAHFRQTWIPTGLSLGDLVYSLPLAPGERQEIAVFEQTETLGVRDEERLDVQQVSRFLEQADTSTQATFQSALHQTQAAGSEIDTTSQTWGVGGGGFIGGFVGVLFGVGAAGGYGSSSASGSTSSWQNQSRDFFSTASESFHSSLARVASSSREATRTGVRLATASDREQVTTKVIANHNHCHALTLQYWAMLRHFAVSSEIDDVELVCYVPLELVPFLPPGEARELDANAALTRASLLARYRTVLRHYDLLWRRLQRHPEHREGLEILTGLAADPTMEVQAPAATTQNLVNVRVTGTFLPFEEITVSVVSRRGAVVGPYRLQPLTDNMPDVDVAFETKEAFLEAMRAHRRGETGSELAATIALPDHVARNDVIRLDFRRRFRRVSVRRAFDAALAENLSELFEFFFRSEMSFSPQELERDLGGPLIWDANASLSGDSTSVYVDAFAGRSGAVEMTPRLPLAASRVAPILRFEDLLKIESVFQHIVRNTVAYSKAVWAAMTAEERAILLERYTIGMPEGGFDDETSEVPLLNCVANRVIGFFGNSMVMPFYIPQQLAEERELSTRDIQEALIRFHRDAFRPPTTSIALPTRGVLGEAILGNCNACEKIDLTRFWNWKDSPALEDATGTELGSLTVRGQQLVGERGAEAPSELSKLAQDINLVGNITNKAGAPSDAVLKALLAKGEGAFETGATGIDVARDIALETLTQADTAREESVKAGTELAKTSVDALLSAMKAEAGLDEDSQNEEKEERDKEAKEKETEEKAAGEKAKAEAAARAKLIEQLGNLAKFVGSAADDAAVTSRAAQVAALIGDFAEASETEKAQILAALGDASAGDSAEAKKGAAAILKALGV